MEQKEKYSPMIEQYIEIKNKYKDYILFYRVGDFYEMFFEDANLASSILELALTGKDAGVKERIPMCGVPFHAYSQYVEKLVSRGYKVAIVEQVEDPKEAKGIVKRDIVKIFTPGTIDLGLNEKENNYIASITYQNKEYVLCYSDTTTGEGYLISYNNIDLLLNELLGLHIKEIVIKNDFNNIKLFNFVKNNGVSLSYIDKDFIPPNLLNIVSLVSDNYHSAAGLLINYYILTQKCEPSFFKKFIVFSSDSYLRLDAFTKRNLEISETLRLNTRNGSILWHLDKCQTAMGSRLLHKWLDRPLIDKNKINERLDFVEAIKNNLIIKEELKSSFKNVYDLERIIGRISTKTLNAKDLIWLKRSLNEVPNIINSVNGLNIENKDNVLSMLNPHNDLLNLLDKAIVENPPLSVKEGGLIKEGYNHELDNLKNISNNGKSWILDYEAKQKELTGIKNLKIGYNKITGYYIEITKGQLQNYKDDFGYERRATLVNSERFISKELKEYEEMILNAKDKIEAIEYSLFCDIRDYAYGFIKSLQDLADAISMLDCTLSLAEVANKYNYVRPRFNDNKTVNIVDGRHPVLESIIKSDYIVNDCVINKYNVMLITGPNMSGKSTYMRMVASIIILAQIGSFVPAKSADLMIFDAIYTRIGASDDLVSGQSTFMVEMMEANYAIKNATKSSLVLFDEIGRGTATFDGMALAQAILEYLHEKVGCVTLFSTHYHELTVLEKTLKRLKNVHVEAKENNDEVIFLHKVLDGPTDKSYGINVARLAGLPKSLIERSKQILNMLDQNKLKNNINVDLFNFLEFEEQEEVVKENKLEKIKARLDEVDINKISPIEALMILNELKEIK